MKPLGAHRDGEVVTVRLISEPSPLDERIAHRKAARMIRAGERIVYSHTTTDRVYTFFVSKTSLD